MAKFTSLDGVDKDGVRAEVNVQTGTGRIKEIISKGEGSRNVEVVFDSDNLQLKRKVSGFLPTEAKELLEYVTKALENKSDISYRIESQRKRITDRKIPFSELKHDEQVIRVIASIDDIYSPEAKTNPKEDPDDGNHSALYDEQPQLAKESFVDGSASKEKLLSILAVARVNNLPGMMVDVLMAQALSMGASVDEVLKAGFTSEDSEAPTPTLINGRVVAQEEKPWLTHNSDGRPNAGSYMVTHAATAEQFALDHLISLYSQGKKSNVDVSDKMLAQAASAALKLLELADETQSSTTEGRANRQKNSYGRALNLVLDAVAKRYPMPLGESNPELLSAWHKSIVEEASERLYGVMEVAHGRLPLSTKERAPKGKERASEAPEGKLVAEETSQVAVAKNVESKTLNPNIASAADALGAKVIPVEAKNLEPKEENQVADDFTPASEEQIVRLKAICEAARVMSTPQKISNWLGKTLGVRVAKLSDAFVLEEWLTKYEAKEPLAVFAEVNAE